jgi:predicted CoA-binding protein
MTARETIEDFLRQKRIAVAGVSRQPRDFTRALFAEFARRGYDVVPVNPSAAEIDGRRCYASIGAITPPVDGVLVMTPAHAAEQVVRDCAGAGVRRVWLYRGTGQGAASSAAVAFCRSRGIRVVAGECPFMFWADAGWFHRFHGFLRRLSGRYPR